MPVINCGVYQESDDEKQVKSRKDLKKAQVCRFKIPEKEKIAHNKLSCWSQVENVPSFNEDFQRNLLELPNVNKEEHFNC